MRNSLYALALATLVSSNATAATPSPSAEGARIYILSPANGEVVSQTFKVQFGLTGMGVAPATSTHKHTGHHHLLIDGRLPAMDQPMDKTLQHFGGGQTETTLTLTPGKHSLRLILGNHEHMPHDPPLVSEEVTVFVK